MTAIHSLGRDTDVLLDLLSQLPSSQLAIAVTQHSSLPEHISIALRQLAALSISEPGLITNGTEQRQCKNIASIVRKLVSRGDPSLVRKLLPSQSSLIDFALCTNAKDLLARLVDETEAIEYIRVASLAFQRARNDKIGSKEDQVRRITKAARILACIVSAMPSRKIIEDKLTRGQRERGSEESTLICSTIEALRMTYESMTAAAAAEKGIQNNESLPVLQAKVSLIDATWFLVERMFLFISKSTKRSTSKEADGLLQALCGSNPLHQGSMPLVDLSLAVDLALVRPLRNTIKTEVRQYSSAQLTAIEEVIKEAGYESGEVRQMSKLGSAWSLVIASLTLPKSNGKPPVAPALVEAVLAVLPYLEGDRPGLEKRLSTSTYAGKDAETVIQLLLEEDEGNQEEDYAQIDEAMDPAAFEDVEALRILQERANVFTDQELEGVKMTRGKARAQDVDLSSGLSADIRAAILARAEEPDSDREEEWNPFSDAAFEVGFEEEMDEEINERERSAVVGLRSPDEGEEEEDDEDDDEVEEGEQDGERGASGHGSGSKAVNEVASERAAERILISAWSEKGESIFTKEARKSAFRTNLKAKLADLPGRKWDDGLIESWGTMFARNVSVYVSMAGGWTGSSLRFPSRLVKIAMEQPRKDKLLASVDDIMRLGNQNIAEPESTAGGQSRYGPDKGRGGRILTGQRGGGQSGGGGGRGGGRGGRGSARGGRGNRGTKRGGRGAA